MIMFSLAYNHLRNHWAFLTLEWALHIYRESGSLPCRTAMFLQWARTDKTDTGSREGLHGSLFSHCIYLFYISRCVLAIQSYLLEIISLDDFRYISKGFSNSFHGGLKHDNNRWIRLIPVRGALTMLTTCISMMRPAKALLPTTTATSALWHPPRQVVSVVFEQTQAAYVCV